MNIDNRLAKIENELRPPADPPAEFTEEEVRRADLIWSSIRDDRKIDILILLEEDRDDPPLLKALLDYHRAVCTISHGYQGRPKPDPDYSGPIQWIEEFEDYYSECSSVIWFDKCPSCAGVLPIGYERQRVDIQPGGPSAWSGVPVKRFDACPYCGFKAEKAG